MCRWLNCDRHTFAGRAACHRDGGTVAQTHRSRYDYGHHERLYGRFCQSVNLKIELWLHSRFYRVRLPRGYHITSDDILLCTKNRPD